MLGELIKELGNEMKTSKNCNGAPGPDGFGTALQVDSGIAGNRVYGPARSQDRY